jgi:hypothetical protein
LCFDKYLGRKNAILAEPDFFATIRNNGFTRINLVKVICFRYSRNESLPADRAIPLYLDQGWRVIINPAFLDNLVTLVQRAAQAGFWVEVCTFHYHAIATPNGSGMEPVQEVPEVLPASLVPVGSDACARLQNFFNPRPADPEQLARQKELINTIAGRLKGFSNVLYEVGNELRLATINCEVANHCPLTEWLNIMGNQVLQAVGQTNNIGTSTGGFAMDPTPLNNEKAVFQTCPKIFQPGFFDFHRGQWNSNLTGDKLAQNLIEAKERPHTYKGVYTPLIINDDGGSGPARTPENVEIWSKAAFTQGLHYITKQTYPNGGKDKTGTTLDFDLNVLRKLNATAAS